MKKKELCVKTKRMMIQPMSDEEIENMIEASDSDELRTAYGEMLSGCKRDLENRICYAPWKMMLKKDHTYIGDLGFKRPAKDHAVEIGMVFFRNKKEKGIPQKQSRP